MVKDPTTKAKQDLKPSVKKEDVKAKAGAARSKKMPVVPPPPSGPKVLRIGVIQSGKIIEERVVRKRQTVTVGHSEKNSFVIPSPQLPARFDLFELKGEQYYLNFLDPMEGRISLEEGVTELGALKAKTKTKQAGRYQTVLTDNSRGKIVIGDSTLLFQFVVPPPIQPTPQLPAAARGGLFKNIDWAFFLITLTAFIVEFGFLTYVMTQDWPVVEGWQAIPDRFAQLLVPPDVGLDVEKKPTTSDEGEGMEGDEESGEEEKKSSGKSSQNKGTKMSAEDQARQRAEQRARLTEALASTGINKILGAMSADGAEGGIADVLRGGDVGSDQDELFKQVAGVGVAQGDGLGGLRGPVGGNAGDGVVGEIGAVQAAGGGTDVRTEGGGGERKIKASMKSSKNATAVDGTGLLDGNEVSRVLKERKSSIQLCYEKALRRNPTLAGKVKIQFTISGSGRVSSVKVLENDVSPEVGDCIAQTISRLRFPSPEGGDVTFANSFLFESAQ